MSSSINSKWVYLTSDEVDKAKQYAEEVCRVKDKFKSTNKLNQQGHYIGKLGEIIYAKRLGLTVNFKTYDYHGDGKSDFERVDVKTTVYWKHPILKEYPHKVQPETKYVLVALDLPKMRGYVVGEIEGEQLRRQIVENFKGLGKRCIASCKTLLPAD